MTKISVLGIAAVATIAFAVPASAQHRAARAIPSAYTHVNVCGYQEPGNPYSQQEDYLAWSAWRARGGWDDRADVSCLSGRMGRGGF